MNIGQKAGGLGFPGDNTREPVDRSRREFLGTAIPSLALTAALPAFAAPVVRNAGPESVSSNAIEDVLARYGSELGSVSRVT
jgi:hypothetical protein